MTDHDTKETKVYTEKDYLEFIAKQSKEANKKLEQIEGGIKAIVQIIALLILIDLLTACIGPF